MVRPAVLALLVVVVCAATTVSAGVVLQDPALGGPAAPAFKNVTISNVAPRLSTEGIIIDAHDGTYVYHDGYYWYHGAEYGLCKEPPTQGCDQTPDHCGFTGDHNVTIFRSKDLSSGSWEFVGRTAQCADLPQCKILYRPHVVYNPTTKLWVLFVNFVSEVGYGGYQVLTAPHPAGPFTLRNTQMNVARLCPGPAAQAPCGPAQGGAGDFDVYVDKDGVGYLIYGANYYMSIEQLAPDFLSSTGKNATVAGGAFNGSAFAEYFVEAPVLFERRGVYYALFGHCCCFCQQGSGVIVHTAPHPMGPWTTQAGPDLACRDPALRSLRHGFTAKPEAPLRAAVPRGAPTAGQGCLYNNSNQVSVVKSQQNFVIQVPASDGSTQYVWTGDLWQQAPDGIKGHEGQFWAPLVFDSEGRIAPMDWVDTFTLEVAVV